MRRLAALILAAVLAVTAVPAAADEISGDGWLMRGRILTTWRQAGGELVAGTPVGVEYRLTLAGVSSWHQHTDKAGVPGIVVWSRVSPSARGAVWLAPKGPRLSGVSNERDALASSGMAPGVLFRSAKLCGSTTWDRMLIGAVLHGGTILELRTSAAAATCPDPAIPGVARVRYPVSSSLAHTYLGYVTSSAARASFGRALRLVATSPGPVWVHCAAGKDRTGWLVAVAMLAAGATEAQAVAEYQRTPDAPVSRLRAALARMKADYGDVHGYLTKGLGLSAAEVTALADKLA